ncbi:MAG: hypothetical protein ABIH20_01570 [Candidatus Diapherotrites archaeon]
MPAKKPITRKPTITITGRSVYLPVKKKINAPSKGSARTRSAVVHLAPNAHEQGLAKLGKRRIDRAVRKQRKRHS